MLNGFSSRVTTAHRARTRASWAVTLGLVTFLCTALAGVAPSHAQTPPAIDGNIIDLINYAGASGQSCLDTESLALEFRPKAGDICKTNALLIPCSAPEVACSAGGGTYFQNGYDLTRAVAAYDRASRTLYLGTRVAGVIGDADGDGTPNAGVNCTPNLQAGQQRIQDGAGIGFNESYTWGLDTNCDGKPDINIRASGNAGAGLVTVAVDGASAGATLGAFTGSDVEVRVENIDLPLLFSMIAFVGATTDGLSEDASNAVKCGPPNVNIDVEKVANPPSICPEGTTTFTITVANPSQVPLTTTLVDELPAGLSYDDNVSGDFTVLNVVGNIITFNDLVIPAGATRTVSFRAKASAQCFGTVTNLARATGRFYEACLGPDPNNDALTASDQDLFDVICLPTPCVELDLQCSPAEACPGDPVTLTASARNCSQGPETITITIEGEQFTIPGVPAGETVTRNKIVAMPACTPGQPVQFNASASASNDCGRVGPFNDNCSVNCSAPPCVQITANPSQPACVGATIQLTGSVTNCGARAANIVVTLGQQQQTLNNVQPGGSANYSFTVTMPACESGQNVTFNVSATASNSCGTDTKTAVHSVPCQAPQIDVEKTALEASVANGGTIHYTIVVSNPSATVALENITVTDNLCSYVRYQGVANPAPASAPAPGSAGGTIVWNLASLAPGASANFTFEVLADVTAGGAQCPTQVNCPNVVVAEGFCLGSNGQSRVSDRDEITTPITCAGENCPRTPGFWSAQCAQRGNGSQKYSAADLSLIASCIDSQSSFFSWENDLDMFCRTVNPPSPMNPRKQAKRQFAAMLANVCADAIDKQPYRGGEIILDPSTPVRCEGLEADTIAELIVEVDALLTQLEGQNLNDPMVKQKYGWIISCVDDINNGRSIPVKSGCEETTSTDPTGDAGLGAGDDASVDAGAVQLYRPSPNPFTGTTQFAYAVTAEDGASVDISVFDVAGRQVKRLVNGVQSSGRHTATWDGTNDDGVRVTRGVYFVRTVIAGAKQPVQRILYVRD